MKTITELNSKMWYRFIKVIHVVFFLFILAISIGLIIDIYKPEKLIDNKETKIVCKFGNKKTFTPWQIGISLYEPKLSSIEEVEFIRYCNILPATGTIPGSLKLSEIDQSEIKIVPREELYEIKPIYKIEGSYLSMSLYILLALTIWIIILELSRRIFYYVVMGKVFPNKKE